MSYNWLHSRHIRLNFPQQSENLKTKVKISKLKWNLKTKVNISKLKWKSQNYVGNVQYAPPQ